MHEDGPHALAEGEDLMPDMVSVSWLSGVSVLDIDHEQGPLPGPFGKHEATIGVLWLP